MHRHPLGRTWHSDGVVSTARSRHHAEALRRRATAIRVAYAKAFAVAVKQGSPRPPESALAAAVVVDHLATQVAGMLAEREMVFAVEALLAVVERELQIPAEQRPS